MTAPLVSVVIPTYNHGRYIRGCIESVIAQTFKDWELIVVDDGCTDETPSIVRAVIEANPERTIVYRRIEGPSGTSVPLNHGIRLSRGEYIAWLSSDDYFAPDKLMRQVAVMNERADVAFSFTGYRLLNEVERFEREMAAKVDTGTLFGELIRNSYAINGSTVMMRRSWIDQVGGFVEADGDCPDIWRVNDFAMWLTAAVRGDKAAQILEPLHVTRAHADNSYYSRVNISHLLVKIAIRKVIDRWGRSREDSLLQILKEVGLSFLCDPAPAPLEYLYEQTELFKFNLFAHKAYADKYASNVRKQNPVLADLLSAVQLNYRGDFGEALMRVERIEERNLPDEKLIHDFTARLRTASREEVRISERECDLLIPTCDYIVNVNEAYRLASFLKNSARGEIAAKLFRRVLSLFTREPEKFHAGSHFHLGELALSHGNQAAATSHFFQCLDLNPHHERCQEHTLSHSNY